MTIKEAMQKGLTAIRATIWTEYAVMRLDRMSDGLYGPWGHIWDPGAVAIGSPYYPWDVLLFQCNDVDWEEWTEDHQRRAEEHDAKCVKLGWKTAMPNYVETKEGK